MTSSTTHRLTADDYCYIATDLVAGVQDAVTRRGGLTEECPDRMHTTLHLLWRRDGRSLHLRVRVGPAGIYPTLYVGDGDHDSGEGIVYTWSFFQAVRGEGELVCSGCTMSKPAPEPDSDPRQTLRLQHYLVAELLGPHDGAPDFVSNIAQVVDEHLRRLHLV